MRFFITNFAFTSGLEHLVQLFCMRWLEYMIHYSELVGEFMRIPFDGHIFMFSTMRSWTPPDLNSFCRLFTSVAFRFNIVGQVTRQFSETPFLPSIFSIGGLRDSSIFLLQWAGTASIDFSLAQLIQVIVLLSTGGNNGGGVPGIQVCCLCLPCRNSAEPCHHQQPLYHLAIFLWAVCCPLEYAR